MLSKEFEKTKHVNNQEKQFIKSKSSNFKTSHIRFKSEFIKAHTEGIKKKRIESNIKFSKNNTYTQNFPNSENRSELILKENVENIEERLTNNKKIKRYLSNKNHPNIEFSQLYVNTKFPVKLDQVKSFGKDIYNNIGKRLIEQVSIQMKVEDAVSDCLRENMQTLNKNTKNSKKTNSINKENEEENKKDIVKVKTNEEIKLNKSYTHSPLTSNFIKNMLTNSYKSSKHKSVDNKKKGKTVFFRIDSDEKDEYISPFVILHESWYRIIWDIFIFLATIYTAIITPVYLTFYKNSKVFQIIEIIFELLYICEMISNFFTTFRDEEENLVTDIIKIRINYFIPWFFYDLLYLFPFEILSIFSEKNYFIIISNQCFEIGITFFKWSKVFRVAKLFNSQTNGRFYKNLVLNQNCVMNRVLKFSLLFIIIAHISSCFFIYIGMVSTNQFNWISTSGFTGSEFFDIYIASLYYNLVTVYTIGYGDITPVNILERIYVNLFLMLGSMIYSLAISSLSTLFTKNDKKYTNYEHSKNVLRQIKEEHNIHSKLFKQIKKAIHQKYLTNEKERYEFLASLPSNLRKELCIVMYESTIKLHNFFKNQKHEFALHVLPLLTYRKIKKGDILLSVEEKIQEIYIVLNGTLSLTLGNDYDNIEVWQIRKNQYFGDLLLQLHLQSPYELKCKSNYSEILVMKKTDFNKAKSTFNSNMINILENSLEEFKLIEDRKRLYNHLFRFCGTREIVKKKAKQLGMYYFNKEFNEYFEHDKEFKEQHDSIYNNNSEEVVKLLSKLDEENYDQEKDKGSKIINKTNYKDIQTEISENRQITKKTFSQRNDVSISERFKKSSKRTLNNKDNIFKPINNTFHTDLRNETKTYFNQSNYLKRPFLSSSNVLNKISSGGSVIRLSTDKINNLTSFTRRKTKSKKNSHRIKRDKENNDKSYYSYFYNKILENFDYLSENEDKSKREKLLNKKTLSIIRNSNKSIAVLKNESSKTNKFVSTQPSILRKRGSRFNLLHFRNPINSNCREENILAIENTVSISINTSKIRIKKIKDKFSEFYDLKEINIESFSIQTHENKNDFDIDLFNINKKENSRNLNQLILFSSSNKSIHNQNIMNTNEFNKKNNLQEVTVINCFSELDSKLEKVMDLLNRFKNINEQELSEPVSSSDSD